MRIGAHISSLGGLPRIARPGAGDRGRARPGCSSRRRAGDSKHRTNGPRGASAQGVRVRRRPERATALPGQPRRRRPRAHSANRPGFGVPRGHRPDGVLNAEYSELGLLQIADRLIHRLVIGAPSYACPMWILHQAHRIMQPARCVSLRSVPTDDEGHCVLGRSSPASCSCRVCRSPPRRHLRIP